MDKFVSELKQAAFEALEKQQWEMAEQLAMQLRREIMRRCRIEMLSVLDGLDSELNGYAAKYR